MAALEQELIQKFKKLDENQQREVLDFVNKLEGKDAKPSDMNRWLEAARIELEQDRVKYGENHFDSAAMLREIREEASEWPPTS